MKTLRYVFFSLGLLTSLNAMDSSNSSSNLVDQFKAITWETHDDFIKMQAIIDEANVTSIKEAKQIHAYLVGKLKSMSLDNLKALYSFVKQSDDESEDNEIHAENMSDEKTKYDTMSGLATDASEKFSNRYVQPRTITTAIELVVAYCYCTDLILKKDDYETHIVSCVDFFQNLDQFIKLKNGFYAFSRSNKGKRIYVLDPKRLPHVLPLLEHVIGEEIGAINFSGVKLSVFPVSILQLESLNQCALESGQRQPVLKVFPDFKGEKRLSAMSWEIVYGSNECDLL
jgi:hypothetical protein